MENKFAIASLFQYEMSLKPDRVPAMMGGMKTIMKLEDLTTVDQLTDFLSGTQAVAFSVLGNTDAGYRWIQGELGTNRTDQ